MAPLHERLPNWSRLWTLILGKASESMSTLEHLSRPLSVAWPTFTRFLSRFQPRDIVLFYTSRAYTPAMPRKLVWIDKQNLQGFGCSECNWMFKPSGAIVLESLEEMKQKYEAQRDKEFAAHVCVKHPRAARPKTE